MATTGYLIAAIWCSLCSLLGIIIQNKYGKTMVKISISVKHPEVKPITPYRLIEPLSVESKIARIVEINDNFLKLKEWANAERNYGT